LCFICANKTKYKHVANMQNNDDDDD
jgi:hypothetical protein